MTPREALVILNLLEGIGPIRIRHLLEFFGEATKVLQAPLPALRRVKGIGDDLASTIRQWETTTNMAGELKRVEEFGARLVFQEDDEYPELLRGIYDPPIVLYAKGRLLPEDRNSIAMVGARRAYPVPLQPEGRQAELPNPQPHRRRDDAWPRGGGGRPEKRLTDHRQYGGGQQTDRCSPCPVGWTRRRAAAATT